MYVETGNGVDYPVMTYGQSRLSLRSDIVASVVMR